MTMSNPARAPTAPLTATQLQLSVDGLDAFWSMKEGSLAEQVNVRGADITQQVRWMSKLDMGYGPSVEVPKAWSVEPRITQAVRPKPYAVNGKMQFRKRSAVAVAVRSRVFRALPERVGVGLEWMGQQQVRERCAQVVRVGGGPVNTIGRLMRFYPPSVKTVPLKRITAAEALAAVRECGIGLGHVPSQGLRPYVVGSADRPVSINLSSSNGLPVMGKFEGAAAEKVVALMKMVRSELDQAYAADPSEGVWNWLRAQEGDPRRSWLVTLLGRCKTDFYKAGKVDGAELRFYNVFPRQLMLIMQGATQVVEEHARNVLTPGVHSYAGVSPTHGGAEEIVAALDRQLAEADEAFVHMGDDSWVVVRTAEGLLMCDLDCSSFDLTQHAEVTEEVHRVVRDELSRVDPVAAQLWYALMRQRLVLTTGSVVRRWFHGGPSGAPLQSKVNDLLMHVLIRRVLAHRVRTVAGMAEAVDREGRGLGFQVRLDNAHVEPVWTVKEYLARRPFLFVGYRWYNARGRVQVVCDLPRTLAQMVYPNLEHMEARELEELEPVRLGSLVLSFGEPPPELEKAFSELTEGVLALLRRAVARGLEVDASRARWAITESFGVPAAELSLKGLLAAVERGPAPIWTEGGELPSTSVWVPVEASLVAVKKAFLKPARERGSSEDAFIHRAAVHNAGRPPSSTFWAPDRPPMLREAEREGMRTRRRKGGYKGGDYGEEDEQWDEESDGSEGSVWEWS